MKYLPSTLFDHAGYIPLKEYLRDIAEVKSTGPWRLPMRTGDRIQIFLLQVVEKLLWFSESLYVLHPNALSPAYALLASYLEKKDYFDSLSEINLHYPGYFFYYIEKKILTGGEVWKVSGQGVARDKATALSKAFGELVERSVSGLFDENSVAIFASPKELMHKQPTVYPPTYHRFLNIQKETYPELSHEPTKPIPWMCGVNLITGKKTYIPKQITSWFYGRRNYSEILLGVTTNGNAGYFTKDGAVLRGLLEVVQRDAFLVHWLTQIPPSVITESSLPESIRKTIAEFTTLGINIHILDTTAIPIPTITVVAINSHAEMPQVVVSSASGLTTEEAVQDALVEAMSLSGAYYSHDTDTLSRVRETPVPFVSKIDKYSRQAYWVGKERVEQFKWFLSGKRVSFQEASCQNVPNSPSDKVRMENCLRVLKKLGQAYEPIVYWPKNSIQKKLGFYVAKIYIPKAFPFYLMECYGTFDSDRLQEFALSRNKPNWQLNPLPHMFS